MSSQTTAPVFSPVETDSTEGLREVEFSKTGFCFWLPCFRSRSNDDVWERISTLPTSDKEESGLLGKGFDALKKVREWSELVAGPKWKTFIRRFNKNRCKAGKFQYDPFSYAKNFDEGPAEDGELGDDRLSRGFSVRYAAPLAGSTKSMNCGKDAPPPALI